ncbi:hypothetical protein P3X46_010541 [Hevea brasiliensis]|uniref:GIR1-like zinc ribbon domain-containing protein n=1 Tax=Hevea brasiliensis TaxID=3981 RepID=A0ABQ9MES1_HEVBR|nr:hypothetical protein P3X46_010541 [Hevea brasiliensis]
MIGRGHNSPKLDLKLNLSPPSANSDAAESGTSSSEMSPKSSCVSLESVPEMSNYASSLETSSMMLVDCPRCLMYVMLLDVNPKCPSARAQSCLMFSATTAPRRQ